MIWKSLSSEARARVISRAILAVGFASALMIYIVNVSQSSRPGYEPEDSKQYLRTMEVYGGKANVFAADLRQWFSGLWHGRSLALTVAVLAVLVALVYRVAATPLSQAAGGDEGRKRDRVEEGP